MPTHFNGHSDHRTLHLLTFFLWGYLKSKVYVDPFPRDVQEVTLRITSEFNLIPQAMIVCATTDVFVRRLAKLVVARGGHLELKVKIRKIRVFTRT